MQQPNVGSTPQQVEPASWAHDVASRRLRTQAHHVRVDKALLALPCTTLNCEKPQYEAAKSNNAFLTGSLLAEIWSCDQQTEPSTSQSSPTAKWVLASSERGIQRGPQVSGNAAVFRDVLGRRSRWLPARTRTDLRIRYPR